MLSCRRPHRNPAKAQCFDALRRQGWSVQNRAWPTFLAEKNGTFAFVNTKARRSDKYAKTMRDLFTMLTKAGVQCYDYTPASGFTRFKLPDD